MSEPRRRPAPPPPGWKMQGPLCLPDYEPYVDVEKAEFAVKIEGFKPAPKVPR